MAVSTPTAANAASDIESRTHALRRINASADAVRRECDALAGDALCYGWKSYQAHAHAVSDLLDDDLLHEFETVVMCTRSGSSDLLRIAFTGLAAWLEGHFAYDELQSMTTAAIQQLDDAISEAVARFDDQRAADDRTYHGLYV